MVQNVFTASPFAPWPTFAREAFRTPLLSGFFIACIVVRIVVLGGRRLAQREGLTDRHDLWRLCDGRDVAHAVEGWIPEPI